MVDEADPYGMDRPFDKAYGLHKHKGYVEPTPTRRRPMISTQFAVGEGNNPKGMQRPNAPYDQDLDPDDYATFKKGERFEGPKGAGKYTGF